MGLSIGIRVSPTTSSILKEYTPPEQPEQNVLTGELGDLTAENGDLTGE